MRNNVKESIFKKHHDYYRKLGFTTISEQAGHIVQVGADYQGRAIYELLQNAFDKADKNILIKVEGNTLYVANDGMPFTYAAEYDYDQGKSQCRGDFQALCSISTSEKNRNESIGNKGVGFKSVFSISTGFVNIHTKGKVIHAKGGDEVGDESISFKIYDVFNELDSVEEAFFDDDLRININRHVEEIKTKYKDRGVPGFYFPLLIEPSESVNKILNKEYSGFITVIEIPLSKKGGNQLQEKILKLKSENFQFIKLINEKDITIIVDAFENSFTRETKQDNNRFFSAKINEKIEELAKNANISINNPRVAIYFRDIDLEEHGFLYNYLPTEQKSPFKYVDFHADFQTSINRKTIALDGNEAIARYNSALLKACIELYFCALNSYLDETNQIALNLEYLDHKKIENKLNEFDWNWLEVSGEIPKCNNSHLNCIMSILNIWWDGAYSLSSDFISKIASRFFKDARIESNHNDFYTQVIDFVNKNSCTEEFRSDKRKRLLGEHKTIVAKKILENKVKYLPDVNVDEEREIFYVPVNKQNKVSLPSFINIGITNYCVDDSILKEVLRIKNFGSTIELLKYYKQCDFDGKVSEEKWTENNQKELIKSLFDNYKCGNFETQTEATHRFSCLLKPEDKRNNIEIEAYFAISTVFLKVQNEKYKPAQLCYQSEIDKKFLREFLYEEKIDSFLIFLGVSQHNNLTFVDKRIYERFKDGVASDQLPAIWSDSNCRDDLIDNIAIISKGNIISPALINKNYNFLIDMRMPKKDASNLLIRKYEEFPEEYKVVLRNFFKEKVGESKSIKEGYEIIRFYQSHYNSIFTNSDVLLVYSKGSIKVTKGNEIIKLSSKDDIELCLKNYFGEKLIFCHFGENGKEIKKLSLSFQDKKELSGLKKDIEERLPYLLIEISKSKDSEHNFLNDQDEDENISNKNKNTPSDIKNKLEKLRIFEKDGDALEQKVEIDMEEFEVKLPYFYFSKDNKLLFAKNCSKEEQAEGIAICLFNNKSLANLIDLVLFRRSTEELERKIGNNEIDLIKQKLADGEISSSNGKDGFFQGTYKEIEEKHKLDVPNKSFLSENLDVDLEKKDEQINIEDRIEAIFRQLPENPEKIYQKNVNGSVDSTPISKTDRTAGSHKKSGEENPHADAEKKETGNQGEIRVLHSFIDDFVGDFDLKEKKEMYHKGINEIWKLVDKRASNCDRPKFETHKNECMRFVESPESKKDDFMRALFALCYFTLHYPTASFDLVVFDVTDENGKAKLIEVKSTKNETMSEFHLSNNEINEARCDIPYEIVVATSTKIEKIGNPIKLLESHLISINSESFELIPKGYEFKFKGKP
jgi:hypothetical protein